MCLCLCASAYMWFCMRMFVSACGCLCVYACLYECVCVGASMCLCVYICVTVRMCDCVSTSVCVCICMCHHISFYEKIVQILSKVAVAGPISMKRELNTADIFHTGRIKAGLNQKMNLETSTTISA